MRRYQIDISSTLLALVSNFLYLRCTDIYRMDTFMVIGAGPRDQPSGFTIANQQSTVQSLTSHGPIFCPGTCWPFLESCAMVQTHFHHRPIASVIGTGQDCPEYTTIDTCVESSLRKSEEEKENRNISKIIITSDKHPRKPHRQSQHQVLKTRCPT